MSPSLDWLAAVVVDACSEVVAVVVAAADETSHAEARLAKPSQASQSREGLTNGIGYFCDGRGQAQGLTTGCGTGYIQFVNGPIDRPTRGADRPTHNVRRMISTVRCPYNVMHTTSTVRCPSFR